jgi:hypothetical protein
MLMTDDKALFHHRSDLKPIELTISGSKTLMRNDLDVIE